MYFGNFNLADMVANPSILIVGDNEQMKNNIIRDIIFHLKNIPSGLIFSSNKITNEFYNKFFPDIYIHEKLDGDFINKLLARQHLAIQNSEHSEIDPSALVVLNNCLSQVKSWTTNGDIIELLLNARHYYVSYILTIPSSMTLPEDLRVNFDYIFILNEDNPINRKYVYDNYAYCFSNYAVFDVVLKMLAPSNDVLIIKNKTRSHKIQDIISQFRPQMREFQFGSEKFQKIHEIFYDNEFNSNNSKNIALGISLNKELFNDYLFNYFINENKFKNKVHTQEKKYANELSKVDIRQNVVLDDHKMEIKNESNGNSQQNVALDDHQIEIKNDDPQQMIHSNVVKTKNYVKLSYKDGNYEISALLTEFKNPEIIEILCNHVLNLKRQ